MVKQGIYDEIVLCYLRDYFTGSIEDMCSLWDKIRGFQMESDKLEERILTWSVFVRSHPKWEQEMLESYIRQSGKEHVILAYLTYLAIGYFMDGKPLSDQMFDYLDRAWKQGWELDEICRFAMLKHLSTKPQLSEEEEKEAHTLLLAFTKQGLRFAFYKDLPEHLTEGFQIGDRMFIEERQRAEAKVTIHYRTNAEETWKSEPMRNMYQGNFCERVSAVLRRENGVLPDLYEPSGRGKNRGENRLHDRRTKSRKDAVPASESDESSARGRRFGKSRRSIPKVSAAGGSGSELFCTCG